MIRSVHCFRMQFCGSQRRRPFLHSFVLVLICVFPWFRAEIRRETRSEKTKKSTEEQPICHVTINHLVWVTPKRPLLLVEVVLESQQSPFNSFKWVCAILFLVYCCCFCWCSSVVFLSFIYCTLVYRVVEWLAGWVPRRDNRVCGGFAWFIE